ncbi:MAG: nascent polypeptide-associated complex protein [Candidatus Helarchaeota archaeon]
MTKWQKIKKMQQQQKAGKQGMGGMSNRQMKRMMRGKGGMPKGMDIEEFPDVEKVVLHLPDREITIIPENVTKMVLPQGDLFQILGKTEENLEEETGLSETSDETAISQRDIELVAQQAGVSPEEALEALTKADGNIARAILQLKQSIA